MKNKLIRTFLSVPVPMELKKKKNMLFSTFENCSAKINWVKSNNLHLTLKFIGYTQESFIDKIINAIQPITNNHAPFNLVVKGTGCFPVPERPRILWAGVNGNTNSLMDLVANIDLALEELGFPKDKEKISPHITLARVKYPQKTTPDVKLFLQSSYDAIDFPIDRVQFFSSELLATGAVYSLLKSFPLGELL